MLFFKKCTTCSANCISPLYFSQYEVNLVSIHIVKMRSAIVVMETRSFEKIETSYGTCVIAEPTVRHFTAFSQKGRGT